MWQKDTGNSGSWMGNWCFAIAYCEDLSFAGHDDWRLPNLDFHIGPGSITPGRP